MVLLAPITSATTQRSIVTALPRLARRCVPRTITRATWRPVREARRHPDRREAPSGRVEVHRAHALPVEPDLCAAPGGPAHGPKGETGPGERQRRFRAGGIAHDVATLAGGGIVDGRPGDGLRLGSRCSLPPHLSASTTTRRPSAAGRFLPSGVIVRDVRPATESGEAVPNVRVGTWTRSRRSSPPVRPSISTRAFPMRRPSTVNEGDRSASEPVGDRGRRVPFPAIGAAESRPAVARGSRSSECRVARPSRAQRTRPLAGRPSKAGAAQSGSVPVHVAGSPRGREVGGVEAGGGETEGGESGGG